MLLDAEQPDATSMIVTKRRQVKSVSQRCVDSRRRGEGVTVSCHPPRE
jgi:hypothetical protein